MKTFSGDKEKAKRAIVDILEYLGEDTKREGLVDTPSRIVKSWDRLFGGYLADIRGIFTTFEQDNVVPHNQIVLLKDIDFYSTCEHHLLPFVGKAHVAYIPKKGGAVVGISKLARLVEVFSRRLQIQERIGMEVTNSLMEYLSPMGAACIIEAKHFCMSARGVEKQHSSMVTSSLRGVFLENNQTRQELFNLIK